MIVYLTCSRVRPTIPGKIKYATGPAASAIGPHNNENLSLPKSATTAITSGAPTTYNNPVLPPGIRNGRRKSGLIFRKRHAASTVRIVTAILNHAYTLINCTRLSSAKIEYTSDDSNIAIHGVP